MESGALVLGTDPDSGRFVRTATPQQKRTLDSLGVPPERVRPAAVGFDLFAYVENTHSTLRVQIDPSGGVVGQTVLSREPHTARRQEV